MPLMRMGFPLLIIICEFKTCVNIKVVGTSVKSFIMLNNPREVYRVSLTVPLSHRLESNGCRYCFQCKTYSIA